MEAGSLFQYFTTLTENADPLLRHLGVLLSSAILGRVERGKEKQVGINIQKALEYLEGGNHVSPKSSPQHGMKAQPRQSLFVGEVAHASYQRYYTA